MTLPKNVVPSLCCIHNGLKDEGCKFNTMTYTQYKKLGKAAALKVVADRSLNNLYTIRDIILECIDHGWNYRIGSNVFPLMTHPDVLYKIEDLYNVDAILTECKNIAKIIKESGIRCSMHPDQFVVPASPKKPVRDNAIRELEQHALIMDLFGLPLSYQAPINIHMNCWDGGRLIDAAARFMNEFSCMSVNVRSRLVLENEDKPKSWSVLKLHDLIHAEVGIPITFDNLHHICNPDGLTEQDAFNLALKTWPQDIIPLFHYSEALPPPSKNPRAHADAPTYTPNIYKNYKNP